MTSSTIIDAGIIGIALGLLVSGLTGEVLLVAGVVRLLFELLAVFLLQALSAFSLLSTFRGF